jgi:hypothetical protein
LYSLNISSMIKSRRIRWGLVANMGGKRNGDKDLVGKAEGKVLL